MQQYATIRSYIAATVDRSLSDNDCMLICKHVWYTYIASMRFTTSLEVLAGSSYYAGGSLLHGKMLAQ